MGSLKTVTHLAMSSAITSAIRSCDGSIAKSRIRTPRSSLSIVLASSVFEGSQVNWRCREPEKSLPIDDAKTPSTSS